MSASYQESSARATVSYADNASVLSHSSATTSHVVMDVQATPSNGMAIPNRQTTAVACQAANTLITVSVPRNFNTEHSLGTGNGMGNQVNNLVATVTAPGGLNLTEYGVNRPQKPSGHVKDMLDTTADSCTAEDSDDGVNLVVKTTHWWCKDCDIKQQFGCGESIEEHLHLKHGINSSTSGTQDSKLSEGNTTAVELQGSGKEITPSSDMVTSVYSIPSDSVSVEDQAVDTLIVLDDTTTLQVVSKLLEEKRLQPESLKTTTGNRADPCQDSGKSKGSVSTKAIDHSQSMRHSQTSMLPTDLKLIPVIPALGCDKTVSCTVTVKSEPPFAHQSSNSSLLGPHRISPDSAEPPFAHSLSGKGAKSETPAGKSSDLKHETRQVTSRRQLTLKNSKKVNGVEVDSSISVGKLSGGKSRNQPTTVKPGRKRAAQTGTPKVSGTENLVGKKSAPDTSPSVADSGSETRMTTRSKSGLSPVHPADSHWQQAKKARVVDKDSQSSSKQNASKETPSRFHSKVNTHSSSGRKIKKPLRFLDGSEAENREKDGDTEQRKSELSVLAPKKELHFRRKTVEKDFSQVKKRACSSNLEHITSAKPQTEKAEASNLIPVEKKCKDAKYACKDCGRKFKFENKLKKHSEFYKDQMMQQCSICDISLHNLDLLNVHIYHVHKTNEPTVCLTCGKTLGSKKNLLHHLLTHPHSRGQNFANLIKDSCATHVCPICHETIIEGDGRVERHYQTHKKPNTCTCQTCGKWFRHKADLYLHLKEHGNSDTSKANSSSHNKPEQNADSISIPAVTGVSQGKSVNNVDSQPVENIIAESVEQILKFEENSLEGAPNQITVTFISSPAQERETSANKQRSSTSVTCQTCSKCFRTKRLLYQHLRTHGAVDSEVAQASGEGNSSGTGGQKEKVCHPIDLSQGVPFGIPCTLVNVEGLEGIMRTFTTTPEGLVVPSQMQLACALCERQFESEVQARRHVNRFMDQRTILQCSLCSLKFHNLDLFNVHHTYIHQPEGSTACMTCSTEFRSKADFFSHLGNSPGPHPLSHRLGLKTFLQDACGKVTCSICKKNMWNYPMNIANHTKTHKSYPCPICQQGFPYKYALLIHLQAHTDSRNLSLVSAISELEVEQSELTAIVNKLHSIVTEVESNAFTENPEGKFCCGLCEGEVTCQRKNIHKHLDLHARKVLHASRDGRYFCHDCGQDIVVTEQSINEHMSSHGDATAQFVCVFCTQAFEAFEDFKEHELKKHWLNMYFEKSVCEVCGKELVSRQELKKHVKLHSERQGLFACPRCKQTFRFESKLNDHLAKHTSGHGSYACQFCGKLYMTKISLHRHEQVDHIGIKDFKHKCQHCEAQFINATHLRDHVTNKHSDGASYTCSECGMGFKHLSTCVRHKRMVHQGDTPYVCKECGERFPVKRLLQRHMISHTGVDPFQCPTCLKSFSIERTLQEHIDFVHRGIIRFQCHGCGSKFPRKRNLVRHISTCRMTVV